MENRNHLQRMLIVGALSVALFSSCGPLKEFGKSEPYTETANFKYQIPFYDRLKKNVIIVANNDGTELFDMMAPYYLFNATGQANVYIVAKQKLPIVVKKGLFLVPQSTFNEIDSVGIKPDVIVIPFLSAADSLHQDPVIVEWIKKHYSPQVTFLSVCDGSATAAATGIFDGKPITAHASDYAGIKPHFSKPLWIQNTSVAGSGNLFSTAGVSNATEGSLIVIDKLFGPEIMKAVIADIAYPYQLPKIQHQSKAFQSRDKVAVGKKILFRKDKKVGVYLQDGINEFELAAIMDTYNRTFPKSIASYSVNNSPIKSKYGLTIIPTGKIGLIKLDELHLLNNGSETVPELHSKKLVKYDGPVKNYIIDECLQRIKLEYGGKFENVVKLMLDYN